MQTIQLVAAHTGSVPWVVLGFAAAASADLLRRAARQMRRPAAAFVPGRRR